MNAGKARRRAGSVSSGRTPSVSAEFSPRIRSAWEIASAAAA
jgi:hypothetical protein